jgi:CRISPR-associated exonuclease Cas4
MFEEVVRLIRVLKDLLEEKKVPILEPTIECNSCQYYERCFVKQRMGKQINIQDLFGMSKNSKNNE